ncbi:hypothetical protein BKA70DRAFT_1435169 [Coprinopsis sp. MPI-PUGE-AT-0042]|nr:hypothetical protein BKA70DRAFT_1435169 [Coprinopsis sp. MPI-PUGE-AT-0042]
MTHPIAPVWDEFLDATANYLDASSIPFSAIAGFGMADKDYGGPNQAPVKAFCPLIVTVGVLPRRVAFEQAKRVALHVKNVILSDAGFGHVDVAIREWRTVPLCGTGAGGMKLDFMHPLLDNIAEQRHPFSSTPSLAIAPLAALDVEGSASLYFRLSNDSDDVFLLTAAHVVRPLSSSSGISTRTSQDVRPEKVISLGVKVYSDASEDISSTISGLENDLKYRENDIERPRRELAGGEDTQGVSTQSQIAKHGCSSVENRIIGTVLHADPIGPTQGSSGATLDWAAVKVDHDKFNWPDFGGNKIFIDGLIQVTGTVPEHELRSPKILNDTNDRAMPVHKTGRATGTTFGWVNGLKTLARHRNVNGTFFDSRELTIIPYNDYSGSFSGRGDSGSAIFDRKGRVVGMMTSASQGVNLERIDLTYATPFYELESRIKEVFPDCFLYPLVDHFF